MTAAIWASATTAISTSQRATARRARIPPSPARILTDLRASMLRIDVDHPSNGKPYGIPKDNPFLHIANARPEIYAFGLRAPWRMSFDPPTGNLWVGEVGQDLWEMIHLVRRGGNYGWSVMEGTHPFYPERKIGPAPDFTADCRAPPFGSAFDHRRVRLSRKTAARIAEPLLVLLLSDGNRVGFSSTKMASVRDHRVLAHSTYHCASWGRDHAGELYLVALSGEILRLRTQSGRQSREWPVFPNG